jgi:hypothetical protein
LLPHSADLRKEDLSMISLHQVKRICAFPHARPLDYSIRFPKDAHAR